MNFNFRENLEKCDMIIQVPDSIQTKKYFESDPIKITFL